MNEEEKKELEAATEIDAEVVYEKLKSALEAFQKLVIAEKERLEKDGVNVKKFSVSIEPSEISIRIGEIALFHEIRHYIYNYAK